MVSIARIRLRRATRPARGTIRVPVQAHPLGLEREYARALDGMVRSMHQGIIESVPGMFLAGDQDEVGGTPLDIILAKIGNIEVEVARTVNQPKARILAQGIFRRVEAFNKRAIGEQLRTVIGVDPIASMRTPGAAQVMVDRFARDNVDLIRTVPERYFEQVRELVIESHRMGRRAGAVSQLLQERFDVAKFNADRIARDQVSKLNANLTESRHRAIGINGYRWRTNKDERVREEHAALEGEYFTWDSGGDPNEGHPGEAIMCRCRPEPDLSAFFA